MATGLPAGRYLAGRSRGLTLHRSRRREWRGVVTGWKVGAVAGRVAREIARKSNQLVAESVLCDQSERNSREFRPIRHA